MAVHSNDNLHQRSVQTIAGTMNNPVHASPVTAGTGLNKSYATLSCTYKYTMTEPFLY
jgi:hypothetical protein